MDNFQLNLVGWQVKECPTAFWCGSRQFFFINFSPNITRIWMAKLRYMQEVGIYEGIKFGVDSNKTLQSTESTDLCQAAGIFNVKTLTVHQIHDLDPILTKLCRIVNMDIWHPSLSNCKCLLVQDWFCLILGDCWAFVEVLALLGVTPFDKGVSELTKHLFPLIFHLRDRANKMANIQGGIYRFNFAPVDSQGQRRLLSFLIPHICVTDSGV